MMMRAAKRMNSKIIKTEQIRVQKNGLHLALWLLAAAVNNWPSTLHLSPPFLVQRLFCSSNFFNFWRLCFCWMPKCEQEQKIISENSCYPYSFASVFLVENNRLRYLAFIFATLTHILYFLEINFFSVSFLLINSKPVINKKGFNK